MANKLWITAKNLARASAYDGLPPLWFMTDQTRVPDPLAVIARLPRGAGVVVRDYDLPDRAAYAHAIADTARNRDLVLLIAGDMALAEATQAQGMHLPEWQMQQAAKIRAEHPDWFLTASVHSKPAITQAERREMNAVFLAPVFRASSGKGTALGPVRFAGLVRQTTLPVFALGGVDASTAPRLKGTGAAGIAAITALAMPSG